MAWDAPSPPARWRLHRHVHAAPAAARRRPPQVKVYAFGAPRAGNHAFARDYARTVPDTWCARPAVFTLKRAALAARVGQRGSCPPPTRPRHVINDPDLVPRGGKSLALFKRPRPLPPPTARPPLPAPGT